MSNVTCDAHIWDFPCAEEMFPAVWMLTCAWTVFQDRKSIMRSVRTQSLYTSYPLEFVYDYTRWCWITLSKVVHEDVRVTAWTRDEHFHGISRFYEPLASSRGYFIKYTQDRIGYRTSLWRGDNAQATLGNRASRVVQNPLLAFSLVLKCCPFCRDVALAMAHMGVCHPDNWNKSLTTSLQSNV